MVKITFITTDQDIITAEADSGSVMELAVNNNVEGIDGDCGGVCSCGTCHVHVDEEDWDKVGEPSEIEKDLLDLDDNVTEFSRLGCQIPVTKKLDGIVLKVANN